jgi:hypothetical protein
VDSGFAAGAAVKPSPLGLALLLAACDPGDVALLAPETSGGAPTLSIHVVIDTPYAALATTLGWTGGVPGARVRVHLMVEPYDSSYWHVAAADSTGVATFSGLGGLYEVEASRPLTAAEQSHVDGEVHVLAGGRRLYGPTTGPAAVTLAPDQRGTLVFSELQLYNPQIGPDAYDPGATYFEVYNNSDTTIYLDGKLWADAWWEVREYPYRPCAQTAVVRNDPDGIWTERWARFPGRGTDHPLTPGHFALIAGVAMDHRTLLATLPDLRHADFEFPGSGGADNPDVPNLESVGLQPMEPAGWSPTFLAEPVDVGALPRYVDEHSGHVYVRIPSAAILDATAGVPDFTTYSYQASPACLEELHRAFERLAGPPYRMGDTDRELSAQRRVLTVLPDGRKLLQDTNTSMFDFVKAPRTPGWIPDSLPGPP